MPIYLIPQSNRMLAYIGKKIAEEMGATYILKESNDAILVNTNITSEKRAEFEQKLLERTLEALPYAYILSHIKIKGKRIGAATLPSMVIKKLRSIQPAIQHLYQKSLFKERELKPSSNFLLTPEEFSHEDPDPCLLCSTRRGEFQSSIMTIGVAKENLPADRNVKRDNPKRKLCTWCYLASFFELGYGGNAQWFDYHEKPSLGVPFIISNLSLIHI